MFFLTDMQGVYSPEEIRLIKQVLERLEAEGLRPPSVEDRQSFARYALSTYSKGLCVEDRLLDFCRVAVRSKYPLVKLNRKQSAGNESSVSRLVYRSRSIWLRDVAGVREEQERYVLVQEPVSDRIRGFGVQVDIKQHGVDLFRIESRESV